EREQRGGHAAAGAQEVAAANPLALRGPLADLLEPCLVLLLLRRLRRRDELLVRGDARRDRGGGLVLGVEIALADPHGGAPEKETRRPTPPLRKCSRWEYPGRFGRVSARLNDDDRDRAPGARAPRR